LFQIEATKGVLLNAQNQLIIHIIEKLNSKKISIETATKVLNVSERTIHRYVAGFSKFGVSYFNHGNKNRIPKNKTSSEVILNSKKLMKEKYFDFNITHALEKLKSEENVTINRESFRKICHEINLVKKEKRRSRKVRKLRSRTPQAGIMLQMDGSHHRWFNDEESCLIGAIDDASNENYYSEFFTGETTVGCLKVLLEIVKKKGLFSILYTDRAGLFAGPKRADFSQVKRALNELGIQIIYASSAQAKGRIERHWGTLQDRLVPEMRLRKIKSYEAANDFLQRQFLPNDYNKNFKVVPSNLESGFQPLPQEIDLNEIFCLKYLRSVKSDHTYSFNGQLYRIKSNLKYSIQNQKIEIRIYLNRVRRVYFANQELEVEVYASPVKMDIDNKMTLLLEEKDSLKVRKDSHVFYQNKYYSVGPEFIGQSVVVREHESVLLFYHRKKLIESHSKIKNQFEKSITKPEHLKPWQDTLLPTSIYRTAAKQIGEKCDRLVFTILQRGQGVVDNKNIWAIIGLKKSYPCVAINEACEFSFETGSASYRSVMAYLNLRYKRTVNS
jgi:transposase